jgi:hypothetical protein
MTQDEIIAIAKRVGFPIHHPEWRKAVEEFAALLEEQATAALKERLAQPEQERDEILQAITDPENQPSQFGTVTLEYHEEKIKQWEELFDRMHANFERASDKVIAQRTEQEPPQRTEQNFCSRCGKRTPDLITIHTCTPPRENT